MMPRTLYISDLDGTLLTSSQTISEYTANTVNSAISQNILFTYATARGYATASKVTASLSPGLPAIVQNGTFIVRQGSGKKLLSNTFSRSDATYIYEILTSSHIHPTVYSITDGKERFTYLTNCLSDGMKLFLDSRRGDSRENPIKSGIPLVGEVFYFACIDNPQKLAEAYEKLKDKFLCISSKDIYFDAHWLEIMPKNAGKANSVLALKKMLDCDRVVCFGDGKNDISMFEVADECYAVANADSELKKIATGIIESNDCDGVAKWLRQNILKQI